MINWIKQQIEWLKQFFSDPDGQASSKRLMSFLVILAFLQSYVRVSLVTNSIQDIPMNWAFVIPAILGIGVIANKIENGK